VLALWGATVKTAQTAAAGFTRHLPKPIDLEALAETISVVLSGDAARHPLPAAGK
jgi:hypothetical protein